MKTHYLLSAAAILLPAVSMAQTAPAVAGFQQAQTFSLTSDAVMVQVGGMGRVGAVAGKPFSATAVTHTVQMLADGSQIENTRTQVMYRDEQGRTRTEMNDGKIVNIVDRVTGINYNLDTVSKTAREIHVVMPTVAVKAPTIQAQGTFAKVQGDNRATDDLGKQTFYGVQAHGNRVTVTIPAGAIGNNRDLKTVTDTWDSADLSMVVKSVSTDPRFGTTTYELTNISTAAPDPALFKVPAGYTVDQFPKRDAIR